MSESPPVSAVAFFPWAALLAPVTLGRSVRLLPYAKGSAPGDTAHARQEDLDAILRAYSSGTGHRITQAALLEVGDWQTGMAADGSVREQLFRARIVLGFAALAHRTLFAGHIRYCCYDTYTLVVQQYQTGRAGSFHYTTRRRDGGTGNYWSADDFVFHRPLHVDSRARVELDERLAACLLDLPTDAEGPPLEALEEFNAANTDSQEVPPHVEVVLMKSAFERLLNIGSNDKDFSRAIQACIPDMGASPQGPLLDRWKARFPQAPNVLGAWAQEFSALRGANAHGVDRQLDHFVWATHSHLAFASMLFPLIVKKKLADAGHWTLPAADAEKLRRIQDYLMVNPFNLGNTKREVSHPWSDIDGEVLMAELDRRMRQELRRRLDALFKTDGQQSP